MIDTGAAEGGDKTGFATGDLGGVGSFRKGNNIPNRSSSSVRCEEVPLECFKHKTRRKNRSRTGEVVRAAGDEEENKQTTELARCETRTNEYQARRHANAAEATRHSESKELTYEG